MGQSLLQNGLFQRGKVTFSDAFVMLIEKRRGRDDVEVKPFAEAAAAPAAPQRWSLSAPRATVHPSPD
ncbi:hypothetical protein HFO65_04035 [Rhizobium laguerreae]|uniref:hypothetical protein n=1 Tax=Rhizobium laguerreae TaxID=1076926 RepID=UPI001C923E0A|nr:hypothetical protein [Rhizobium laguerreae]MBY3075273.1 hypothetical protein [Rhizobium laguerreae]MBY3094535.1 hypothetical protein [Rhizobium laguerreae]MBY3101776.1 hypothetical protein [Rhizobium laguerreae]MBY3159823.1 hypothetical protein [Rhizobium laguerreae]UFW63298.1 hypothetical protein RlegWSM1455_17360 [Rhizobium laguerreae]